MPAPVAALAALAVTALDALWLALALGGFGALLAHPRALALLGVWAIGGVTLALLRPVRAQDVIEQRTDPWLMLWLLLLPLATPPLAAWGERAGWWPLPGGEPLRWLGVAVSGLGLGIRVAAMARLGNRFSPTVALQREHALETRGLYAWVRHPGYSGAWLAAAGGALAFGSALGLVPCAAFAALLALRARREEALLERHFGDAYRAYRARTGAFWPALPGRRQD